MSYSWFVDRIRVQDDGYSTSTMYEYEVRLSRIGDVTR